jgi:hypothetical protein
LGSGPRISGVTLFSRFHRVAVAVITGRPHGLPTVGVHGDRLGDDVLAGDEEDEHCGNIGLLDG